MATFVAFDPLAPFGAPRAADEDLQERVERRYFCIPACRVAVLVRRIVAGNQSPPQCNEASDGGRFLQRTFQSFKGITISFSSLSIVHVRSSAFSLALSLGSAPRSMIQCHPALQVAVSGRALWVDRDGIEDRVGVF